MNQEHDPELEKIRSIDYEKLIAECDWPLFPERIREIYTFVKESKLFEHKYLEEKNKKLAQEKASAIV